MRLKILFIIALSFCITLVVNGIFIQPLHQIYVFQVLSLKRAKAVLRKKQLEQKNMASLKSQTQVLKKELEAILAGLPSQEQLPAMFEGLYHQALGAGLAVIHFSPKQQRPFHFIKEQDIDIKLQGNYAQLLQFFKVVENLPGLLIFDTFVITRKDKTQFKAVMEIHLQAKIYQNDKNLEQNQASLFVVPSKVQSKVKTFKIKSYPIQSLEFVGVMQSKIKVWALVKIPSGSIVPIRQGDYLGKEQALVVAISETEIKIQPKEGKDNEIIALGSNMVQGP